MRRGWLVAWRDVTTNAPLPKSRPGIISIPGFSNPWVYKALMLAFIKVYAVRMHTSIVVQAIHTFQISIDRISNTSTYFLHTRKYIIVSMI